MFADLNNLMEIDSNSLPNGQRILIIEKAPSSGSFVICHLLSLYIRSGHNVCLVGVAQTFYHYSCIANKMAINLAKFRESGHFQFVEALKFIGTGLLNDCESENSLKQADETVRDEQLLKGLYSIIKESVEQQPGWPETPTLLLVDDISMLTSVGYGSFDVAMLAHYLQTLVCTPQPSKNSTGCMACLVHTSDQATDDTSPLHLIIGHRSDVIISVQPLKTGYCRDLNGEISIRWPTVDVCTPRREPRTMHFKMSDRQVSLCPLGMSTAVL